MLRRLSLAAAIATAFATPSWAAEPPMASKTDLLSAYQAAVANNADLAAAEANLAAQQEGVPQARAALLPNLNASANTNSTRTSIDSPSMASTRSGSSIQAKLSQPLFNAAAWFQLEAAKSSNEQAVTEFSAISQDLILQSAQTYYDILRAQDLLAASKAEEAAFKRQLDQSTERFDVGLSDKTDVLEAQASYDTAKANRLLAERQVDDAFQALITLTNQDYSAIEGLMHSLPILPPAPLDAQAWVDTATQQNLRLQASNYAVDAAEETLKQRKSGHAPTLNAVASYSTGDNDSLGFVNNSAIPTTYSGNADQSIIGLELNVPLYSGGLTSSQVRQAYQQLQQSEQLRESQRRNVVQNTRNLYRAVTTDVEQVQARKQSIISNQSALEATEIGYEVGTRDIVDVLNAQRQLYSSVRVYNNARYDYIINNLRLKQAAGTLSPTDLESLDAFLTHDYDPDKDFLPPDLAKAAAEQLNSNP